MIKFIVSRTSGNVLYKDTLEVGLKKFGLQVFQAIVNSPADEEPKSKKYNTTIDALFQNNLIQDEDIVCICDEDVSLLDMYFSNKLEMVFKEKSITLLGVLGTSLLSENCEWWMNPPEHLRGHIFQQNPKKLSESNHFEKGMVGYYDDIVAIDRCFMAIRGSELQNFRFDDTFSNNELYNIDFCLQILEAGKKIAVADILLGRCEIPQNLTKDEVWQQKKNYLCSKWKTKGYVFPLTINNFGREDSGVVEVEL